MVGFIGRGTVLIMHPLSGASFLRHSFGSRQEHCDLSLAQHLQGRHSSFGSRLDLVAEETPRLGPGAAYLRLGLVTNGNRCGSYTIYSV